MSSAVGCRWGWSCASHAPDKLSVLLEARAVLRRWVRRRRSVLCFLGLYDMLRSWMTFLGYPSFTIYISSKPKILCTPAKGNVRVSPIMHLAAGMVTHDSAGALIFKECQIPNVEWVTDVKVDLTDVGTTWESADKVGGDLSPDPPVGWFDVGYTGAIRSYRSCDWRPCLSA